MSLVCGPPANLAVPETNSTGTIYVSWTGSNITGVTYILEKSHNGGNFSQVYSGSYPSVNVTVNADGSYVFRVRAVWANFADSDWVAGATASSVALACGPPADLAVPAYNSTGTISLTWTTSDIAGVTYVVQQSVNGGAWSQIYSGFNTQFNHTLTANGSYTFRVRATKSGYADSPYAASAASCTVTMP